ncbi:MAG TPA: 7TM diverse intracellular signaling domain-containing protein [Oligoflexus sp.]|uniref:7TM diverse intracellular signaling domain-containing protein n=1 Tax=Oligoflexus sp. TaxID=1971216 RepID=UPI002D3BF4BF|nr:7TM diverse intracellular signaling domain-containing protein [Oligoflexus sp.]HYX35592.1 7TM diverse intracellular signaling domain-containing protein [Oligoflexus sp.]
MTILLLPLLFLACTGKALADARSIDGIKYFFAPSGKITPEDIAKDPSRYEWKDLENGEGVSITAETDYFILLRAPSLNTEQYVLTHRIMNADRNDRPYYTRLFALENQSARPLPFLKNYYGSYIITQKEFGKILLLKFQRGKFPGLVKLQLRPFLLEEFEEEKSQDLVALSSISGIMLTLIVYNAVLFLMIRKIYLLYYALYASCALYYLMMVNGAVPYSDPTVFILYASLWGSGIFVILMSFELLSARSRYHYFYKVGLFQIGLQTVVFFAVVSGYAKAASANYITTPACFFLCFALAGTAAYRRYIPAYAMLVGWLLLFTILALSSVSIFSSRFVFTGWFMPLGFAVEAIAFSFAMAQKARLSEMSLLEERTQAINDSQHAFAQLTKVFYPHQIALIKNGEQLERTMPTGPSRACVISFDIVSSSKIQHINAPDFFRNVFKRCNDAMMEGYDGRNLRARAYRIKEMGDGFLCAVGYPFQSLSKNPANDALDLAIRFSQILTDEAENLHPESPICCGIGIAIESLNGFYPETGTKEYDLFGPAIILATRYEGMRKTLFEGEKPRSVIIIQERVYHSLDREYRTNFIEVNLREKGLLIRDDPAAVRLYYQFREHGRGTATKDPNTLDAIA